MRAERAHLCLLALLLLGAGCDRSPKQWSDRTITVFAAASTSGVLTDVAEAFEAKLGVRVEVNFAATSTLAQQLAHGAHADVYLAANPQWMSYAQSKGLIQEDTRRDLLGNDLVLIAPAGVSTPVTMEPAFDFAAACPGRIAVADPDHVPAGIYAKQALESLGWWEETRERLIPCLNVRSALRLVERGEVSAGIVYGSDARASDAVHIIAPFPSGTHVPIRYPIALCRDPDPAAIAFIDFLTTPAARAQFAAAGFEVLSN